MFKITLNEAFLLVEARRKLSGSNWRLSDALNAVLNIFPVEAKAVRTLRVKINEAIAPQHYLADWLDNNGKQLIELGIGIPPSVKLRKAWIKKLLAYNGY